MKVLFKVLQIWTEEKPWDDDKDSTFRFWKFSILEHIVGSNFPIFLERKGSFPSLEIDSYGNII